MSWHWSRSPLSEQRMPMLRSLASVSVGRSGVDELGQRLIRRESLAGFIPGQRRRTQYSLPFGFGDEHGDTTRASCSRRSPVPCRRPVPTSEWHNDAAVGPDLAGVEERRCVWNTATPPCDGTPSRASLRAGLGLLQRIEELLWEVRMPLSACRQEAEHDDREKPTAPHQDHGPSVAG